MSIVPSPASGIKIVANALLQDNQVETLILQNITLSTISSVYFHWVALQESFVNLQWNSYVIPTLMLNAQSNTIREANGNNGLIRQNFVDVERDFLMLWFLKLNQFH